VRNIGAVRSTFTLRLYQASAHVCAFPCAPVGHPPSTWDDPGTSRLTRPSPPDPRPANHPLRWGDAVMLLDWGAGVFRVVGRPPPPHPGPPPPPPLPAPPSPKSPPMGVTTRSLFLLPLYNQYSFCYLPSPPPPPIVIGPPPTTGARTFFSSCGHSVPFL